ncbi:hypothetical protein MAF45_09580 [Mesosutterella sp. OilRF-GAM-744-9]|uniref:Antitermination protein Q n=1 Tax=Mesosutterella porci TaxID=2915351 RepID=A0ABS9MUK1_9BURK|nr:hypothetical protein [Mesosutterella sp. oilRF-744-WT-GAM-9]MCG5031688.1 hypothetical protein [Mesosutterella sp. oilRF-744-WT-GAM-9]
MTESELNQLKARLVNWGRWSRSGRGPRASALLGVLVRMGYKPDCSGDSRLTPDESDAVELDRAIASLGNCPERTLLIDIYVQGSISRVDLCRRAGIRRRFYDQCIARAYNRLYFLILRDTICSDNSHAD